MKPLARSARRKKSKTVKIPIIPIINKFKKSLLKKNKILPVKKATSLQENEEKKNKRQLIKPTSKKNLKQRKIDSSKLREPIEIGSDFQRTNFPLSNSNDHEYFTSNDDKCDNCQKRFTTISSKKNHINIFRNKKSITHVSNNTFDVNKNMSIICMSLECCVSFSNIESYQLHLEQTHNQLLSDTVPIYQDTDMGSTHPELACHLCRGEFTTRNNLNRHLKNCTGFQQFHCDICPYTSSKFERILKHGKNKHKPNTDFEILEEFKNFENPKNNSDKKTKEKIKLNNMSVIYKTWTKIFNQQYTSLTEALSEQNQLKLIKIIRSEKSQNANIKFSLCTPVIIAKQTEWG